MAAQRASLTATAGSPEVEGYGPGGSELGQANFLELPARSSKPRRSGLTHVLDKGLPLEVLRSWLELTAPHVDVVKLGWGTAYVSGDLREKVAACREAGVRISVGGTLLEIAAAQGKVHEFTAWALGIGLDTVEVSNGAVGMDLATKRRLIRRLSADFMVLSEVGSKDERAQVQPARWATEIQGDLEAGAENVLLEGRESGTAGLYELDGSIRERVVDVIVRDVDTDRLIFEAPRKTQQVWLIRHLGPAVNLGNIAPEESLGVETLRLGLRADTVSLAVPGAGSRQSEAQPGGSA
jgi:phosphosulfolactate synthase